MKNSTIHRQAMQRSAGDSGLLTIGDWILCVGFPGIGILMGLFRILRGNKSGLMMMGWSGVFMAISLFLIFVSR